MQKTVCAKFKTLHNVVGRVDYISNPKRQEHLLGFAQTSADPNTFWRLLSVESRERDGYNRAQMEEHNRREMERYQAGEIKRPHLLKTVEARENILALPNDLIDTMDMQELAQLIADDVKARLGIECAVGVHHNKTKTNLHAHIILPERILLPDQKQSIATRNTYFDATGKRSSKAACTGDDGQLLPGCRMVRKGEALNTRRFSEKDPRFAAKGFCYGEKQHYAKLFNEWSRDTWVVYNRYTNPHMKLINLRRGEPAKLRAWKEQENAKRREYNALIDRMIEDGGITKEQALAIKERILREAAEQRELKSAQAAAWEAWRKAKEQVALDNVYQPSFNEWWFYNSDGERRGILGMLVISCCYLAGFDLYKSLYGIDEDLVVKPVSNRIPVIPADARLRGMVDDLAIAAGREPPSSIIARHQREKYQQWAGKSPDFDPKRSSLADLIGGAADEQSTKTERNTLERER